MTETQIDHGLNYVEMYLPYMNVELQGNITILLYQFIKGPQFLLM